MISYKHSNIMWPLVCKVDKIYAEKLWNSLFKLKLLKFMLSVVLTLLTKLFRLNVFFPEIRLRWIFGYTHAHGPAKIQVHPQHALHVGSTFISFKFFDAAFWQYTQTSRSFWRQDSIKDIWMNNQLTNLKSLKSTI